MEISQKMILVRKNKILMLPYYKKDFSIITNLTLHSLHLLQDRDKKQLRGAENGGANLESLENPS